jgi:4-amino-4-deoxy-L-arabinose transferase-like glycosyltransferase
VGLGILAKGPVAVLLPALSLAGFQLFHGRPGEWKDWHLSYVWITLVVASPWYIAVILANGFDFIQVFFIDHNFRRFATTELGHRKPFYYYLPALLMLMLPWTSMLLPGLRRSLDRVDRLLLWFAIVPIVFFSLSGSKLAGYILPSVAPLILICARGISVESSAVFRLAVFVEAGFMLVAGVGFGLFGHLIEIEPHISGTSVFLLSSAMAVSLAAIATWMKPPTLVAFNAVAMFLIVLVTTGFVLRRFEATDTMRPWKSVIQAAIPDDQTVYMYQPARWAVYGMQYYRYNKARVVVSPEELRSVLAANPRLLFVSDDSGLANLGEIAGVDVEIIATVGNQSLFWVSGPP